MEQRINNKHNIKHVRNKHVLKNTKERKQPKRKKTTTDNTCTKYILNKNKERNNICLKKLCLLAPTFPPRYPAQTKNQCFKIKETIKHKRETINK